MATLLLAWHANGTIRGHVNLGSVVVFEQGDAWVIDFGGSYNSAFVDREVHETAEMN